MNKQEIIEHLKNNRNWILQCVNGINTCWWWLRNRENPSETIDINGNSGKSASKSLIRIKGTWNEKNYSAYAED